MISGAQDMSNAVRSYNINFDSDDRGTLPGQVEMLALADIIGDAAVRVRIAGPKIVADAAYGVLDKCTDAMSDLAEYVSLTQSSFIPVDHPDIPLTIITDRPIVRHAEVQASLGAATNALVAFLDVARDHLDDWNGQAA
ncbi:hypothetical protein [Streptomyces katrae]|uniref:Uncharacterized protein n=1 Tax=Streptomyces katrae TaxID=68223 RepID=A0A0F4JPW7_9ACTN|nr:hypothetical protein [Streptomyces katrae]KJY36235.1 hypothetical protein VR44_08245 [Streptomyces katrae]